MYHHTKEICIFNVKNEGKDGWKWKPQNYSVHALIIHTSQKAVIIIYDLYLSN